MEIEIGSKFKFQNEEKIEVDLKNWVNDLENLPLKLNYDTLVGRIEKARYNPYKETVLLNIEVMEEHRDNLDNMELRFGPEGVHDGEKVTDIISMGVFPKHKSRTGKKNLRGE